MHTPVFLDKVLAHIDIHRDTRYIDCTLGQGGHTMALIQQGIHVLAIDADQRQIDEFKHNSLNGEYASRVTLVQGNYRDIVPIAQTHGFTDCAGVLFDLGLSMNQYERADGFSYKHQHQPLEMIIDTVAKQEGAARAADVVARYEVSELVRVFERWGEISRAEPLAQAIVRTRRDRSIRTVGDLVALVAETIGRHQIPKVFQALRIEVNSEISNIEKGLAGAWEVVRPGGLIQIISFHSIEDRIVKQWAQKFPVQTIAKYVGAKGQRASFERSAVLRVVQKSL